MQTHLTLRELEKWKLTISCMAALTVAWQTDCVCERSVECQDMLLKTGQMVSLPFSSQTWTTASGGVSDTGVLSHSDMTISSWGLKIESGSSVHPFKDAPGCQDVDPWQYLQILQSLSRVLRMNRANLPFPVCHTGHICRALLCSSCSRHHLRPLHLCAGRSNNLPLSTSSDHLRPPAQQQVGATYKSAFYALFLVCSQHTGRILLKRTFDHLKPLNYHFIQSLSNY